MIVQADRMVRDVRVALDLNSSDGPLVTEGDVDTLSIDELIVSKLADAARLVEEEALHGLLEAGHDFGDSDAYIAEDGTGYVVLPRDFVRLVSFRMSDWERTVYEAITEGDPRYARQSSRWAGVRGNAWRPVCAVVVRSEGRVLEWYSSRDGNARIVQATYIPERRIDADGGIDISAGCYRAAVYRAAWLVMSVTGDAGAEGMLDVSRGLLRG